SAIHSGPPTHAAQRRTARRHARRQVVAGDCVAAWHPRCVCSGHIYARAEMVPVAVIEQLRGVNGSTLVPVSTTTAMPRRRLRSMWSPSRIRTRDQLEKESRARFHPALPTDPSAFVLRHVATFPR